VPLNTARKCCVGLYMSTSNRGFSIPVLAVQNMDAYGSVPKTQEIEFKALEGSLNMMSKGSSFSVLYILLRLLMISVLNDVLDL
jgi:hypothetical protein